MSITSMLSRLIGRFFKPKPIKPIGIRKWPVGVNTNCLGFVLGHEESFERYEERTVCLDNRLEIGEAFITKVKGFGYKIPRRINGIVEANDDEFVIAVFGFASYQTFKQFRGIVEVEDDFHLVRRELDGTWVHKPGWYQSPRVVTEEDEEDIRSKFDVSKVALFAFEAPSK